MCWLTIWFGRSLRVPSGTECIFIWPISQQGARANERVCVSSSSPLVAESASPQTHTFAECVMHGVFCCVCTIKMCAQRSHKRARDQRYVFLVVIERSTKLYKRQRRRRVTPASIWPESDSGERNCKPKCRAKRVSPGTFVDHSKIASHIWPCTRTYTETDAHEMPERESHSVMVIWRAPCLRRTYTTCVESLRMHKYTYHLHTPPSE